MEATAAVEATAAEAATGSEISGYYGKKVLKRGGCCQPPSIHIFLQIFV